MNIKWFIREYKRTILKFLKYGLIRNSNLLPNEVFKNKHRGERCFILGSGHSINKQDLSLLNGEIVMTQNNFHFHSQIDVISPTYHVLVPKYQPPAFDSSWIVWLESMEDRLPKSTKLFLDINTRYLVDSSSVFQERAHYLTTGYSNIAMKKAPIDLTRPLMNVPTVLCECLAIAIYMGFDNIYLLGFDLDQNVQLLSGKDRDDLRFYGKSAITNNDAEKMIESEGQASGEDWLVMWTTWQQCGLLRSVAQDLDIKITNLTLGGLLNVFPRARIEDIVHPR
jgi:hypothetical protein